MDPEVALRQLCPREPGLNAEVVSRTDGGASLKMWLAAEPQRWVIVVQSGAWFDVVLHEPTVPAELGTLTIDEDPTAEEMVEYLNDYVKVALQALLSHPQRYVGRTGAISVDVEVDSAVWTLEEQRGCGRSLAGLIGYGIRRLLGRI